MYTFDVKLTDSAGRTVAVDTASQYGYWERSDGSEGGELLFEGVELIDYDGAFELPRRVIEALLAAGFTVDDSF